MIQQNVDLNWISSSHSKSYFDCCTAYAHKQEKYNATDFSWNMQIIMVYDLWVLVHKNKPLKSTFRKLIWCESMTFSSWLAYLCLNFEINICIDICFYFYYRYAIYSYACPKANLNCMQANRQCYFEYHSCENRTASKYKFFFHVKINSW